MPVRRPIDLAAMPRRASRAHGTSVGETSTRRWCVATLFPGADARDTNASFISCIALEDPQMGTKQAQPGTPHVRHDVSSGQQRAQQRSDLAQHGGQFREQAMNKGRSSSGQDRKPTGAGKVDSGHDDS